MRDLIHKIYDYFIVSSMYWLIIVSIIFWIIEIVSPWRKQQKTFRKDFVLDGFYMFFNLYIVPIIGLNFLAALFSGSFTSFMSRLGVSSFEAVYLGEFPTWLQLLVLFVIRDFVHFNIHRLLHRVGFLWELHKVHHSVKEMGFAAHLRFHWAEGAVYRTLEYIPLALLGFSVADFTIVYMIGLLIGHSNHSNYFLPLGKLKYVFNNPQMHIWHHSRKLPTKYGVNFGMSLSIWDYLFRTNYVPSDGRDIELGFEGDEKFPTTIWKQCIHPINIKIKNHGKNLLQS